MIFVHQINNFIKDTDLNVPGTHRVPVTYTEEHVKFMKKTMIDRILDEEANPVMEAINVMIKDDRRFSKDVNEEIRTVC